MSNNNEHLNDDESDALRRELEARASNSSKSQPADLHDDSDDDLEAFLRSLEDEDVPATAPKPTQTATAENDPFADQFAELEAAYGHEIVLPEPEPIKPSRQDAKAAKKQAAQDAKREAAQAKKDEKAAEKQAAADAAQAKKDAKAAEKQAAADEKKAKRAEKAAGQRPIALRILLWTALGLPVFCLWWLVGSFLAQWISAAWLIAIVTTGFAFGLPALIRHLAKRGRYVYWLSGTSLLLTILLVAPMPATASKRLAEYGHWPASTIAEISGLQADHALVTLNASIANFTGRLIDSDARQQPPHRLGTDTPLSGELDESGPTPPEPDTQQPDALLPGSQAPNSQKPQPTVPAPQKPERAQPENPTQNPFN